MSLGKKLTISIVLSLILSGTTAGATIPDNARAIQVSGGEDHTLVLTADGAVWGCGWNLHYQLGIGDNTNQHTLVRVHGPDDVNYLEDINDIDAGWYHSLALDVNGFVWAWGANYEGQLGDKQTKYPHAPSPIQVLKGQQDRPSDYLENIIAVSAGATHSMALEKIDPNDPNCNGCVYTWGYNGFGKLGIGTTGGIRTTPVKVLSGWQDPCDTEPLKNILAISAGWDHSMALEKIDPCDPNCNGTVYTWGRNGASTNGGYDCSGGRLGDGTTTISYVPVIVKSGQQDPNDPNSYLKDIIAISAGDSHCLALDVNGCLWAWGDNTYGQLGDGTNNTCTTPIRVVGLNGQGYLEDIVAISAGYWHSLAVDSAGTIWTWGVGTFGRLGLGDPTRRNTPHPVPTVRNITQGTTYFRIQPAIDDANNDDVLEASIGSFAESIDFLDRTITLRSTDPDDWNVVANTKINGGVTFDNNQGSLLTGFTIRNGSGIDCLNNASPQIINCIIQQSWGAVSCDNSSPQIINSIIQDNYYNGVQCTNNSSLAISYTKIQRNAIQRNS